MKIWRLGTAYDVLVDDEDLEELSNYKWYLDQHHYVYRSVRHADRRRGSLTMHRQLMGGIPGDGLDVDHRNHNPQDNRRANLRLGPHSDNMQNVNAHRDNKYSNARGVGYDCSTGVWIANHTHRGKAWTKHCATEEEAIATVVAHRAIVLAYLDEPEASATEAA